MKKLSQRLENIRANEEGEYRYVGTLYGTENAPKVFFWVVGVCELVLILFSGSISTPGTTGRVYVILPFVAELCFACLLVMGLGRLGRDWTALTDYNYDYALAIPLRATLTFIAAVCGILGEGYSAFTIREKLPDSILFISLRLLSAVAMLVFRRRWRAMKWTERESGEE